LNFESLCVIGMGYIGLPTASIFASKGIHVTGMDINTDIIEGLNAGKLHIFEPGLRELVLNILLTCLSSLFPRLFLRIKAPICVR